MVDPGQGPIAMSSRMIHLGSPTRRDLKPDIEPDKVTCTDYAGVLRRLLKFPSRTCVWFGFLFSSSFKILNNANFTFRSPYHLMRGSLRQSPRPLKPGDIGWRGNRTILGAVLLCLWQMRRIAMIERTYLTLLRNGFFFDYDLVTNVSASIPVNIDAR